MLGCPYFADNISEPVMQQNQGYMPSIEIMGKYCFTKSYGLCPALTACQDHKYQEVE